MMPESTDVIRPARAEDRAALSRICLETANAGKDATDLYSDGDYPGLLYVLPYAEFEPDFAFVLEMSGEVVGYVVATPDTAAFEARLAQSWWPVLQERYAQRTSEAPLDMKVLGQIRAPGNASEELTGRWPAHLHINLLPVAQQGGWGRRLVTRQLAALRDAGVPGVHLGVSLQNEGVCAFYEKMGFRHIFRRNAIYMGQVL
ncbi:MULTISPECIES: GNAT family N-acetyltransferase [Mangrovibacter]|uniref:Acetyltransferase (GNAT) family protein n=1 Tax=Mangrovibacter plantisponsor TaxID=451513 RepID=A0A317Q885_9ENTR|nr:MULTISPECIES: GNAT family N-acetyltransferase [Mangrovibacter]KEA51349.1 acetyltransferase [Mangrovibacter sp. MFB070]PWW11732.1 acetyltransferase (GNAT) family protein [Mangrovibacter plantisponsor]